MTKTTKDPQGNERAQGPTIQQRRRILLLLVILTCGGYGVPRLLLLFNSSLDASPATSTIEIYDKFRKKARLVQTIRNIPGHKGAASDAFNTLRTKTNKLFKAQATQAKRRDEAIQHQLYLGRYAVRRSLLQMSRLCQEQRHGMLDSLLYPTLDLSRLYDLAGFARLSATKQSHTARLAQLAQRRMKAPKRTYMTMQDAELSGLALIAAGRYDKAYTLFARTYKRAKNSYRRAYIGQTLCSLRASLRRKRGKGGYSVAPQDKISALEPRCRAMQAWALTQRGRGDLALQQLPHWSSLPRTASTPTFLSMAAALAQQKQWFALGRLWRWYAPGLRYSAFGLHDVFHLFNPIFTHTVPPSLFALLQHQLEVHFQSTKTPEVGLSEMHTWLLVVQGRQALLLGEPAQAKRLLTQALARSPRSKATKIALTLLQIEGLTQGPKAALAAMARLEKGLAKTPQERRQWQLLEATYAAYLQDWKRVKVAMKPLTCHTFDSAYQGTCRLLVARLQKEQRKGMIDAAAQQKAAKIDYAEPDPMVRLLNTPPKLRSAKAMARTLRYIHPGNASPGLHARLLLYQLLDPSGKLAASYIPRWHCTMRSVTPTGHLLTTYLLEGLAARRKAPTSATKALAHRRYVMGHFYRKVAELWLPKVGL